jgi:hypothetical protein
MNPGSMSYRLNSPLVKPEAKPRTYPSLHDSLTGKMSHAIALFLASWRPASTLAGVGRDSR